MAATPVDEEAFGLNLTLCVGRTAEQRLRLVEVLAALRAIDGYGADEDQRTRQTALLQCPAEPLRAAEVDLEERLLFLLGLGHHVRLARGVQYDIVAAG